MRGRHALTRRALLIFAATAALLLLAGGVFLARYAILVREPVTGLYLLAGFAGCVDLVDLAVRLRFRRRNTRAAGGGRALRTSLPLDVGEFTPYQVRKHLKPYALLVSVHNLEAEIDGFLESVEPLRERLWVIDDASTDGTFARLERAGIRCVRSAVNLKKPGALKQLIEGLDPAIATVVVMDPDSQILDRGPRGDSTLDRVIFEFQRSGMAALSPRLAIRDDGLLARLQELEYWMAFTLGRMSLRDRSITSGIAVYRRDALERTLKRHTLSVYAEDLKNAILLLTEGEGIYYDGRLVVQTEGKRTLSGWFSQRVGWHFGLIKVYAESFGELLRAARGDAFFLYHFVVYTGLFALLFHPIKLVAVALLCASLAGGLDGLLGLGLVPRLGVTEPSYFLFASVLYTTFAAVALFAAVDRGERLRLAPAVPLYFFYSILHTVPVTLGYLNWFSLRLLGRRVYRDHFGEDAMLSRELAAVYP